MLTYRVFLITKALLLRLLQRQPRMELKRVLRRKGFVLFCCFWFGLIRSNACGNEKKIFRKQWKCAVIFWTLVSMTLTLTSLFLILGYGVFAISLFGLLYKFDFNIFLPYFAINLGAKRCSGYFHWTSLSDTNWKKKLTGCHHILT